jgi:pimeloyl-ACP methyl ester carboxylesterase
MADPLLIQDQGGFAVGGAVLTHPGVYAPLSTGPEGQTMHADHAFVTYQVPSQARPHPVVFLHGNLQFSKTWSTTPDGRDGFQNIFLRKGYPVYLVDQPRRGAAGKSSLPAALTPAFDDQFNFNIFRVGIWPDYFPGVQFPKDAETLNQYFRQTTPNTGPFDLQVVSDAMAALFEKIGQSVLVTHSQGGGPGWLTAIKNKNVAGIVSYEPGSNYVFPEGEVPAPMPSSGGPLEAIGVPMDQFMRLTQMPIVVYYGDNIPTQPNPNPGQDVWRVRVDMAHLWADAINSRGGDVTIVELPKLGIHGNTHFPFSDLNNLEIAELMHMFLVQKGLA